MTNLYTVDTLHDTHGISKNAIYDSLTSGQLVGFKIGGRWYVHPEDWDAYIDRRRAQSAGAA